MKNAEGNNWFLTKKNEIVRFEYAQHINGLWYVHGCERKIKSDFYTIPISSSKLNIFKCFTKEETAKMYAISEITSKMFWMPYEQNYDVFVPLNHTVA